MRKYELEDQDLEFIKSLIKTSKAIETLYEKMYQLEINGQKDTEDYKKIIDYLKMSIDVENKIYEDASLNAERCIALINYILQQRLPDNFLHDIESIMGQRYDNKNLRRILGILANKVSLESLSSKQILSTEMQFVYAMLGNNISNIIRLLKEIENDVVKGFLSILKETISNYRNRQYKNDLIYSKYYTSFINKNIEKIMINNDFDISSEFCIVSKEFADLIQVDSNEYDSLRNSYSKKVSMSQISEVIKMKDVDYNDQKKAICSLLRQCLIRSAFLLMDEENILNIYERFHTFIEDDIFLRVHGDYRISEESITRCFLNAKKDQDKKNELSLSYEEVIQKKS